VGEEKAVGEKTGAAQNETDMFGNKSEQQIVTGTIGGAAPREPFEHSRRPAQEGG